MNTSALKSFAPAVRTQLMEAVTRKLDYVLTADTPDLRQAAAQVSALRREASKDRKGLIERVAYTWFNRLTALRFLDAQEGWHPFKARVLTPATAEETQPELLKLFRSGTLPAELHPHTDLQRLNDLLDGRLPTAIAGAEPQGEVYRHLVLAACRFYHALLPNLFEAINDETELLLPDDLLTATSVAEGFRTEISDVDCAEKVENEKPRANVEILGWLYQFYISERKDQVMARKSAVPTEDIPAVTQLFTPHWIVRYLVENSLGRLWMQNRPNSRLIDHMPYYIEDSGQGSVPSGQNESHANQDLQRPDCVAESHGPSGGDSSPQQIISPGGTLRADQPDPAGSGIGAVEHRGGASTADHGGVQELSLDLPGLTGRSGDATLPGDSLRVSNPTTGRSGFDPTRGNLQNAVESPLKTDHWPLTTDHSAAGGSASEAFLKIERPEDIRLCDPAVGSAHMLTYAFDLLYLIYAEEGYAPTEIPALILRHNLHGLEICPRAAQLAELALVFKAREKDRSFFRKQQVASGQWSVAGKMQRPHIIELRDVRFEEGELPVQWLVASGQWPAGKVPSKADILHDLHLFTDAKNFGSLLQPKLSAEQLSFLKQRVTDHWPLTTDPLFSNAVREHVLRVLEQAEALTQRYHVVVANPPYMGFKQMNSALRSFGEREFKGMARDLFGMFIQRCQELGFPKSYVAMITMDSWMYGDDHTDLREWIYENLACSSMLHLGPRAFDEIDGEVVQVTSFVFDNRTELTHRADYFRLVSLKPSAAKEQAFLARQYHYRATFESFADVPRKIMAYQATERTLNTFRCGRPLREVAEAFTGLQTGDNPRFIHYWFEVSRSEIAFSCANREAANATGRRWFPYVKGSDFRKWFGNNVCVLDWFEDGKDIWNHPSSTVRNSQYYFQEGLAYNNIANSFSVRHVDEGFICDQKNSMFFGDSSEGLQLALGFLNSPLVAPYLDILSPKDFNPGSLKVVPTLFEKCDKRTIGNVVQELIDLARADWDNFETSWDFRDHPLLRSGQPSVASGQYDQPLATGHLPLTTNLKGRTLEESWINWKRYCDSAIQRMQELETENNRLFIAAYGLDGELQPEVPEAQITLARAEARRDMAAFLSYAVGCMMGRYSLSAPGLILANAGDTVEAYWKKVASVQWPVASDNGAAGSLLATGH
jgi:hypothetical protein